MPDWTSPVVVGSTVIFILAFTLTTILHELAHALTGLAQGESPVLHHTFVMHEGLSPSARALTAAAGPLFSLVQGIVFAALVPAFRTASALTQLFVLWMAIHGLVNFFGYLVSTPFAPQADLGKVARYLNLSAASKFGLCAAGLAAQAVIGLAVRESFLRLAPAFGVTLDEAGRTSHILAIVVVPWLVGAAVAVLTRLPSPQWVNIAYPILSGLFSLVTWWGAASADAAASVGAWDAAPLWPWTFALLLVLVFFRFVLARGIRLGRAAQ